MRQSRREPDHYTDVSPEMESAQDWIEAHPFRAIVLAIGALILSGFLTWALTSMFLALTAEFT